MNYGIEILEKIEIMEIGFWSVAIPFLATIPSIILYAIGLFKDKGWMQMLGWVISLVIVVTVTPLVASNNIGCYGTGKYQYKVKISDEVRFNEFNEKYEIIKQEGEIYTIKEKEK